MRNKLLTNFVSEDLWRFERGNRHVSHGRNSGPQDLAHDIHLLEHQRHGGIIACRVEDEFSRSGIEHRGWREMLSRPFNNPPAFSRRGESFDHSYPRRFRQGPTNLRREQSFDPDARTDFMPVAGFFWRTQNILRIVG